MTTSPSRSNLFRIGGPRLHVTAASHHSQERSRAIGGRQAARGAARHQPAQQGPARAAALRQEGHRVLERLLLLAVLPEGVHVGAKHVAQQPLHAALLNLGAVADAKSLEHHLHQQDAHREAVLRLPDSVGARQSCFRERRTDGEPKVVQFHPQLGGLAVLQRGQQHAGGADRAVRHAARVAELQRYQAAPHERPEEVLCGPLHGAVLWRAAAEHGEHGGLRRHLLRLRGVHAQGAQRLPLGHHPQAVGVAALRLRRRDLRRRHALLCHVVPQQRHHRRLQFDAAHCRLPLLLRQPPHQLLHHSQLILRCGACLRHDLLDEHGHRVLEGHP
mmetsp:Transcript_37421/g.97120  ORF Transcript_37421/g.97120 Transcript_37421/m.97120 type:complete len:331 (-) Transcript_37421:84-1076(-)